MKLVVFMFICYVIIPFQRITAQQNTRIESEYKLAVPDSLIEDVALYLSDYFSGDFLMINRDSLQLEKAVEIFKDSYFDTRSGKLLEQQIGLRHRRRYLNAELINELVQLKLPDSEDGVQRQEIKFNVPTKINVLDEMSRKPLLKYVNPSDRDLLTFNLRKVAVSVDDLREIVKLTQIRDRIYFSDKKGSVATVTLDKVKHASFPFQGFTELEIEINESRYTNANNIEKAYLENISEQLKLGITKEFPLLKIDQTPKYNKLMLLIQNDFLSKINNYFMWGVYGFIFLMACFKFFIV